MAEVNKYDPAIRRERYLRERELKGRQPGKGEAPSSGSTAKAVPKAPNTAARAAAAKQVASIKAKLESLKAALAKLPKTEDKPSAGESKAKDEAYNEKYYTENKTKIANDRKSEARSAPSKSSSTSSAPKPEARSADDIRAAIRTTLVELKAAVAKLKAL